MKFRIVTTAALMLLIPAVAAHAEGDAAKGEQVFKKCMACHSATDATNRVGPSLHGVVGRPAASVAGYNYSEAMKKKAAEGTTWDEATLDTYLTKPQAYVPGTKMAFPGLANADDRANVIAYLKTQSQ